MKFLEKLNTKSKTFQRTFGLSLERLHELVDRLEYSWTKAEQQRKSHENRKRKIGAGHPYKFQSLEDKVRIVLLYYKIYPTQEFLGTIAGLDQANVSRLLKKMLPLIEKAADPQLSTYLKDAKKALSSINRVSNFDDFFAKYPDLRDASTDATEQSCYRPKDNETQKYYYSGKKKRHTIKYQLTRAKTGRFLDVSDSYGGSVHDKTVVDKEKTIQKLPKQTCHRFDLGYQGVRKENPYHYLVLPIKKPKGKELSNLDKEHNRLRSQKRVVAEHGVAHIKKFRICSDRYRGPLKSHNQTVRNIVSILNFRSGHSAQAM